MQVIFRIHTMLDHRQAMFSHMVERPYHGVPWSRRSRPHHPTIRRSWPFMRPAVKLYGCGPWPTMSEFIVGWPKGETHQRSCMKTMQHAFLSLRTATSKETGRSTSCLSSSSRTSYRKPARSKWSKCVQVTTKLIYSPNHFLPRRSRSSRIRLGCVDWKTFSDVQNRGSNTCCTLFPSPWFCPIGFSW